MQQLCFCAALLLCPSVFQFVDLFCIFCVLLLFAGNGQLKIEFNWIVLKYSGEVCSKDERIKWKYLPQLRHKRAHQQIHKYIHTYVCIVSISITVTNTEAFNQPSCNVFVSVFFIHLLSSFQLFCCFSCFSCFFVFSSSQSCNKNNSGCPQTSPFGNCSKTRHSIQFKPTTHIHTRTHSLISLCIALLCFPAHLFGSNTLVSLCLCVTLSISIHAVSSWTSSTHLKAHTLTTPRPPPPAHTFPSKRCANISIILSRLLANSLQVHRLLHNNKIKCLLSHTQAHKHPSTHARSHAQSFVELCSHFGR